MTLAPIEEQKWEARGIHVIPGVHITPNPVCAHPDCDETHQLERHHIFPKSFLKGDYEWWTVEDRDGDSPLMINVVWLCPRHHLQVTGTLNGHQAWIAYNRETSMYDWIDIKATPWTKIGTLSPFPTTHKHERKDTEKCPTCGHRKEKKSKPAGPVKEKTRAVIMYPKDEKIVWDELVEEVKKITRRQHETTPYFALVECMVFLIQHKHLITREELPR